MTATARDTTPTALGSAAPGPSPSPAGAALLAAAAVGRLTDVETILAGDPDAALARDDAGDRAVVVAAFHGHRAVAERVARALGPSRLDPWEAALVGDAGALAARLDADPSLVHARRHDGWPLLHLAVSTATWPSQSCCSRAAPTSRPAPTTAWRTPRCTPSSPRPATAAWSAASSRPAPT
jgi:hypothetical protein